MQLAIPMLAVAALAVAPVVATAQDPFHAGPGPALAPPDSTPAVSADARRAQRVGMVATLVPVIGGVALAASGGDDAAVAGILVAAGGLALGPAIGDWSAGLTGRGFAGFGIRLALGFGGLVATFAAGYDCTDCGGAYALLLGTAVLTAGHAVWDITTLPKAEAKQRGARVTVAPVWVPATGSPGLGVRVGF
jgi:hypothetical protein